MHKSKTPIIATLAAALIVIGSGLASVSAWAAQADISSTPLASTTSAQVKPNIMLLMDTSGSMGWSHMPDELESTAGVGSVGYKSSACNVLYYNPAQKYEVPKKPDGSLFPTPTFLAAAYNGYASYLVAPDTTDNSVVNLSTSFRAYDGKTLRLTTTTPDTAQPAYYYTYTGTQTPLYAAAPCTDADTNATRAATGGGTWTRVLVGSLTATEQTNFAIWYTYYRTRMSLTKSAASLAFTPLTDSFRVGFITMQPKDTPTSTSINASKYVAINDFNSTQRSAWFAKLFSQVAGGASPAREGLARVGRHYAGKQDYINVGMTGDPVQYSCQQNFTIMTTDGYWNTQTETPGGGPVQMDGTTLVGNQDNIQTGPEGLSPPPIWDGSAQSQQVVEDNKNAYAYAACGSFAYLSTTQALRSTSQNIQSTSQLTQSTQQNLQSTNQILKTTVENLQSTSQITKSTLQKLQNTVQNLQSTLQNLQSTTQNTQSTAQTQQSTNQNLQSTTQNLRTTSQTIATTTLITQTVTIDYQSTSQNRASTTQTTRSTAQTTQSTAQRLQSTTQNLKSTNQNRQSTTQTTQSTAQTLQSTQQNLQSTTQNRQSTTQTTRTTAQTTQSTAQTTQSTSQTTITTVQVRQSTRQDKSCDAQTELCSAVPPGSCTPGGFITCQSTTTGPTLVASCTPQTATAGNGYNQITCASTQTGPNGASSCTPSSATSANSYTTTTCSSSSSGPTPVASCTPVTASSGNSWTAITCGSNNTGPTAVSSCSASSASSGNNWTTTTCGTNNTGPTGVSSCSASSASAGNNWTTTTCGTNNTTNVAVASCTAASPTSANGYTTTTCSTNNTTNVAVATCTASGPTSGNGYTTTTCGTNNSSAVPVQSCTAAAASSGNSYTTTICTPNNTGPTGVSSCSSISPSAGNNWTNTTCGTNNTSNVAVATCTASGPTSANAYTTTTCPAPVVTTNQPSQTCTPSAASSGNGWTSTTCSVANTGPTAVQTCTPVTGTSGNSWVTTTCADNNTGPTAVQTCTASAAASGNNWVATTCGANNTGPTGVASCAASGPTSGNSWTTTTCGTNNTTNVGVQTCTASGPTAGNAYVTTTCSVANTGPTAVATCTPSGATAGNSWVTTTCSTTTVSGPTVVGSCTPVAPTAGNGFQRTTCGTQVSTAPVATCTPSSTVTCATNVVGPTPVQTCTPSGPTSANNYTTTTCSTNNTTNTPVATCTASAGTAGNNWVTTTCPAPVTTGPTFVASCTPAAANAGNTFTSTTCSAVNTGPTPVSSCTPSGATAGNSWTTTTCGTNNTTNVGVQTCTASGPTAGNNWVTTTCPAPATTTNVPVQTCTPSAAAAGNSWKATTCSTNNSTNVPVGTCTASAATSGNSWTTTSCPAPLTSGPTGVASCTADPASLANSWVATTCGNPTTTNVAVASCTPSGPTAGNNYVTTTCSTNNTTNAPAASCTPSGPTSANGYTTTTCPSPIVTSNVPVQTCTPATASSGNNYVTTTCPSPITSGPTGVATCTPVAASAGNNWVATTCNTVTTTNVPVQTCTAVTGNAGNNWTTTTCPAPVVTTNVPVASCVAAGPTAGNSWKTTTCGLVSTGPTLVTTCTPETANAGNNYTASTCSYTPGKKVQYTRTQTITTTQYSNGFVVGSPSVVTTPYAAADVDGFCYIPGAEPPLPTPNPGPSGSGQPGPNPPTGCSAWPCTTNAAVTGGSVNSLADVAQYYYKTDLRPSMTNNVRANSFGPEDDRATWQHMTTFTIALGVSGTLNYRSDYRSATTTTGDFADIRTTAKSWPLWPDPSVNTDPATGGTYDNWNNPRSIDDFWHTAVNGRGQYFSAGSPSSVVSGLSGALSGINATLSAGAAAGTSSLEPVAGDNFVYLGNYKTAEWSGDVQASTFDVNTGAVGTTVIWSAQAKLDQATKASCDNRSIYLIRPGDVNNMVPFTWNTRACDSSGAPTGTVYSDLNASEMANFDSTKVQNLSHYPSMTDGTLGSADQISLAAGANLVNFLRGQTGNEGFEAGVATKLYRDRVHVLGDVVGGQPTYVKAPKSTYQDAGYQAFKDANAARVGMVYVAANDGMLHAFYAGADATDALGGKEAWAIIPTAVLPNLYKLADNNYANVHQFYVDGTPVVGDVRDASTSTWKTMLVGGLNAGGKSYYAIDVTAPASPKVMWEFKFSTTCYDGSAATAGADCHLGLTFGKPVITKIKDPSYAEGRWVVLISSGYNNVRGSGASGDGRGYLYVLDAITGKIIYKIDTGEGDATTPSNLGQLNAYIDDGSVNNLAVRVYGGDMLGNLWRFDVNDTEAPAGREATKVGQAKDSGGQTQPITTRPELAELNGKPMIFVATGRLLGTADFGDLQGQSIYGIVDQLTGSPVYADLRVALKPMVLTQVGSGATAARTVACSSTASAAQCASTNGWMIDLPEGGERVNIDMKLVLSTLVAASNVPVTDACSSGGHSWLNYIDFASGTSNGSFGSGAGGQDTHVSEYLANSLTVGLGVLRLQDGRFKTTVRVSGVDGNDPSGGAVRVLGDDLLERDLYPKTPGPTGKRISWREISTQ